ncbi:fatty-acid--CoA ligase FadD4 [Mycobacterium sp. ACS4331]|uniref:fatty-acid--CoA ligase FadD4 n=1 Tax=Mycobacterium sp. ACS4331 TaxID=1834121 RepID=UPI0007FF1B56|nr:fatty-acid--CoA ligase FadD4 [Mycobacterium sp. ACS4331]OBF17226.1 acyl-CoA synthetase [Mycobacterium sp. ACS4331]
MDIRCHVGSARPAVVLYPSGAEVTFAQLDSDANRLAHHLRNAGLVPGDALAILMENNQHIHAVMWAARRCGLYYTPINTHLTTAEIAYIVADCGAKAIVASSALREICAGLDAQLPDGLPAVALIADDELEGWQSYPGCLDGAPAAPFPTERVGQLLQYSAGSTGRPKGIRRPPNPEGASVPLTTPVFEALGVGSDSVYLSPAPIYHTAPAMWTMAAQSVGATTVVMERFDAEGALDCIQRYAVTHAQFVPTMFVRMLRLPEAARTRYDLSSLQRVVHAAAPCAPEIKKQMIDWWGRIIDEYYGSSEGVGVSFIRAEEWLEHPGSVGRPLLGTPHVLDEHGTELAPGEIGEIYFAGGYRFDYLNDAEMTAAATSEQGWVTVGDIGYVDTDGYLFLTDRRNNVIISGGVNIYPQEIEHVLITHPLVVDAAVFGMPDSDLGQTVTAVVELVDPAAASTDVADELMSWVRDRLAHYKCPRSITLDRLPRTDAGKLYKNRLIERHVENGRPT